VTIRESPTLTSTGQTTITPQGDGFHVSSFFDVFTELSLDGGNTWTPNIGAASHFESTPEPTTLLLTGGALILLGRTIRRRHGRR